jgi:hypothetical protein
MEGCIMFRRLLRCSAFEQLIGNTGAEIRLAAVSHLWNYFASAISNGIPAVTLLPTGEIWDAHGNFRKSIIYF